MRKPDRSVLFIAGGKGMGGAEIALVDLFQSLPRDSFYLIVLCPPSSYLARKLPTLGVEVWTLPIPAWRKILSRLWFPRFLRRVESRATGSRIDAVVANDFWCAPHALRVAESLSSTPVAIVQDSLINEKKARQYLLDRFPYVATVSDFMLQRLKSFIEEDRLFLLPGAVDTKRFSPDVDGSPFRRELGVSDDETLLLSVGTISAMKGQDRLVEALWVSLKAGRALRIAFVGRCNTPLADRLQFRLRAEGLMDRVHFLGEREDLPLCLAGADIFVHLSERESFGLAMAEAMSSGKCSVYSKCDGLRELTGKRPVGLSVDRNDLEHVRHAVEHLQKNPDLRRRLGENARRRIESNYSTSRRIAEAEKILSLAFGVRNY